MVIKNKRGWITVLEATIAVMLISGVLMVVYVRQGGEESQVQDYIFSLQKQVLSDISSRTDLRIFVLENNETALNSFVQSKIPPAYSYSVKLCDLGDDYDHCLLNETEVRETRDKDLFAEETIISSELDPNNPGDSTYEPRKVRLFVWEAR